MPVFAALVMPSRVAYSPVTWPKPRLPSTIAIESFSKTIVGAVLGRSQPLRTHSRYLGTRSTPCES
jgi:hypothetical protein